MSSSIIKSTVFKNTVMRLSGLFLLISLVGCASTELQRNTYLLRYAQGPTNHEQSSPQLGIRQLTVASYISGSGLVLETSPGEINRARYHLWAEPLRESLRGYMADAIAFHMGQPVASSTTSDDIWPLTLDIEIDQFHGDAKGSAILAARWRLLEGDKPEEVKEYRWLQRQPLAGDGYNELVKSQKQLLDELAREIVTRLRAGDS